MQNTGFSCSFHWRYLRNTSWSEGTDRYKGCRGARGRKGTYHSCCSVHWWSPHAWYRVFFIPKPCLRKQHGTNTCCHHPRNHKHKLQIPPWDSNRFHGSLSHHLHTTILIHIGLLEEEREGCGNGRCEPSLWAVLGCVKVYIVLDRVSKPVHFLWSSNRGGRWIQHDGLTMTCL